MDDRPNTSKQWITKKELCQLSGYSPAQIQRWVRSGRLPYVQPGGPGGHLRFSVDVLQQIQSQHQPAEDVASQAETQHHLRKLAGRVPKWKSQ